MVGVDSRVPPARDFGAVLGPMPRGQVVLGVGAGRRPCELAAGAACRRPGIIANHGPPHEARQVATDEQLRRLRQATAEAQAMLRSAAEHLQDVLTDEPIAAETPAEASNAMGIALDGIRTAIGVLKNAGRKPVKKPR